MERVEGDYDAVLGHIYEHDPGGADLRLCPRDAGTDVRRRGIVVLVPRSMEPLSAFFELYDDRCAWVRGTPEEIVAAITAAGYMAELEDGEAA